jgi:hypothetical protein
LAFLEHCFENKLASRTHSVYGQKDAKISYKSKKSPKPNLVTFFAFFLFSLAIKDVKIKAKNLSF